MTEITRKQTIFFVLKHPKNMHIEFLNISEVAARKRHDFISNQGKAFAHWSGMTVSTRDTDLDIAPPLQNVRVDTQHVGIIEEQKQQIKELKEELAEFNRVQYRTLPRNISRGKNVLRTSKKMSMTVTDHINQQAVASYVREAIWPGNKMLPKS
jgi:hypothetical protein